MKLGLSSAAAPDASFDELLAVCARRGFAALELRAGDWHGVDLAQSDDYVGAIAARAAAANVDVCAYVADGGGNDLRLARISAGLGVPLVVHHASDTTAALERCAALEAVGAHALLLLDGTESDAELDAVAALGTDVAFEAVVSDGLSARAAGIVPRFGARVRHIRLIGGGPEGTMQEGQGIGRLLGSLALSAYSGSLVIAPSSSRYRVLWQGWLGRRGWGCGSRAGEPVILGSEAMRSEAGA